VSRRRPHPARSSACSRNQSVRPGATGALAELLDRLGQSDGARVLRGRVASVGR
jgi:hypothetical protein